MLKAFRNLKYARKEGKGRGKSKDTSHMQYMRNQNDFGFLKSSMDARQQQCKIMRT